MRAELFERLRAARQTLVLATWLPSGEQALFDPYAPEGVPADIAAAGLEAARRDASSITESGDVFLRVYAPPRRLIAVGAVHIAQPLARIAALAGFDVTVVDPRGAFATAERFPGVALSSEWPDEALERLAPDRRTAVVTLSHDPKIDEPALRVALASDAFYVGALGSRKTHAARLERLRSSGLTEEQLARISAPIGLAIGASSAAEIAVSIMAQVIERMRRGSP